MNTATQHDLVAALQPFAVLGGPQARAFHDLEDDVAIYSNSGHSITAGDVRTARAALAAARPTNQEGK